MREGFPSFQVPRTYLREAPLPDLVPEPDPDRVPELVPDLTCELLPDLTVVELLGLGAGVGVGFGLLGLTPLMEPPVEPFGLTVALGALLFGFGGAGCAVCGFGGGGVW